MAYSADIKAMIGAVRSCLEQRGITRQSERFISHGLHEADQNSPLILVACSGGRDSMALVSIAHTVCGMLGLRCGAIIVDHALFPTSAEVAQEAAGRCAEIGVRTVEVRRISVERGRAGIEAAAREARYAAICDAARELDAALVLLAHTQDDQAETVLMGLLRGGGLDALAGMPKLMCREGVSFARPLLAFSREQTTQACRDLGIGWWDDPSNGEGTEGSLDAGYPLRSRVRHDLIPMIDAFVGARIAPSLAAGAQSAALDADFLDDQTEGLFRRVVNTGRDAEGEALVRVDAHQLAASHPAIRLRVFSRCLETLGLPTARKQIEALDHCTVSWHGQGPIALSSGYSASRQGHVILICKDGGHANR
ncbi:tRNA lysidine(34) synthetase TilS [Bifidobacterium psychraerophilum]|uniref:tRNA(Ile)-lysidine synthase n=1 Tax=Bifidobacterium psychraerophilum TaxID=218140 RepID=A0A087CGA6_9BIFI|nr:tRNA lysidine(34) synthetase TilS [Bifidobacterium psychraerophilum]KFI82306.1 tRNA(Ile)-lysidine synthase [Bifidobacterium psychraerophilum]PKA95108.1 tRNA(Ile)-lysidine synthase [Bifidobacterium psychraerophilum DSM 22366]